MKKSELIKSAVSLAGVSNLFGKAKGLIGTGMGAVGKQYNKIPGLVRYPLGVATVGAFPAMNYFGGKSEMEDHVANKAAEDSYMLTQARIADEWQKMPAWKRYVASTIGIQNSMALKDKLSNFGKEPLMYENYSPTGKSTYT
jgi:hypothetical protein